MATDATLITERYYLCAPIIEKLPVLRISSNFSAAIHTTENNPINETHFLQQHLQVLSDNIGGRNSSMLTHVLHPAYIKLLVLQVAFPTVRSPAPYASETPRS